MANMKNCLVCGKEFKPCNTCSKSIGDMYNWHRVVCCREHFYYHVPIIEYIRKGISKSEARKELTQAIQDYGEIDFADNIKSVVEEILAEDKKSKKSTKVVNNDVIDDNTISETVVVDELDDNKAIFE